MKRLARKERFDGHGATVDLAFFHRKIDGAAALIAKHDGEFRAYGFFQQPWENRNRFRWRRRNRIWAVRWLCEYLRSFCTDYQCAYKDDVRSPMASR